MIKPKVTVGFCVRNCEHFIKDAIDSVVAQDFPHNSMELVFVDDGSEDQTLAIIKDYTSTSDISSKIIHTPWKGLGHARNLVVANSNGEYLLWVDGDMILSKNYLHEQVTFMDSHPKVGAVKGKQALEPGANMLATLEGCSRAAGRMVDYSSKNCTKALGTGGTIFRLETILKTGGFDENLRGYCEDQDLEIKVRDAGWTLDTVDAKFFDYERCALSWKSLWTRYWSRGFHTHYFLHKRKRSINHFGMIPPAAFASGLLHAKKLYKLTRRKIFFLLPFEYVFKMCAWYVGFLNSHLSGYQPNKL